MEVGDGHNRHPEVVGDVCHRLLPLADVPSDENRLVPALAEAGREVRDVERRPAHVQACDRPEDPDRGACPGQGYAIAASVRRRPSSRPTDGS
jgi:hypothetical protein